jgi:hypothetical protein
MLFFFFLKLLILVVSFVKEEKKRTTTKTLKKLNVVALRSRHNGDKKEQQNKRQIFTLSEHNNGLNTSCVRYIVTLIVYRQNTHTKSDDKIFLIKHEEKVTKPSKTQAK